MHLHKKRSNHLSNSTYSHRVPTSYFHVGDRYLSVLLARLRNYCSSLNFDLFRCNLVPSPLCACGKDHETVDHYLLQCELFNEARQTLFNFPAKFTKLLSKYFTPR